MPLTKEQLLYEVEDLLRNVPHLQEMYGDGSVSTGLAWLGRASAVIRSWEHARTAEVMLAQQQMESLVPEFKANGHRRIVTLLNEARHTLRMATVGPLSVSVPLGQVYDYFDEIRRLIEIATQDVFFVDPYLDTDFVSRYLNHVPSGVTIRLLARQKLPTLLPAVDLFTQQSGVAIQVRSAPNFHDRYMFVDRKECYQSGASFKDGARSSPTTLTQITDAFPVMLKTYEDIWTTATVQR